MFNNICFTENISFMIPITFNVEALVPGDVLIFLTKFWLRQYFTLHDSIIA